jgi:hypothetical protein
MGLLKRRTPTVPADLRDRLEIPAREKLLAWGDGPRGDSDRPSALVAATDSALYVEAAGERFPWDRISQARWEEPLLEVDVLRDGGRPGPTLRLHLDVSGDLPAAIHDRVTASVVASELIDLGDGVIARMIARRASDGADIHWTVAFQGDVNPEDPELQKRARESLAEFRSALGI